MRDMKKLKNVRDKFCSWFFLGLAAVAWLFLTYIAVESLTSGYNRSGESLAAATTEETEDSSTTATTVSSEASSDISSWDDVYEEEILPDGIYLNYSGTGYRTVGILTTGTTEDGLRVVDATFYGSMEYGYDISTYQSEFTESETGSSYFVSTEGYYELEFLDFGMLYVHQLVDTEDLTTDMSFEDGYIFLYEFENNITYIEEEDDAEE